MSAALSKSIVVPLSSILDDLKNSIGQAAVGTARWEVEGGLFSYKSGCECHSDSMPHSDLSAIFSDLSISFDRSATKQPS